MRRTYRSKKDTVNVVERRDLFQNLDGKSTAYDAFSIQNIKQTKRELSCVGSSNPLGVASSRVRKKKYVKRIVKEVELPCRESMSSSAYLTPDKSIRVNKALDPFDLLLISSPANSVKTGGNKIESVSSKVNLFDQIMPKKESRTYTKRKPKEIKKLNYSSTETSDSDKENSDNRPNITRNTSDIKSHKLLVEREVIATPNKVDQSINNIVKNLSLLNKLKHKYNTDDSINKSLRLHRHRLTKNIHSPILQKSPLCSTPFKVKYRGESIYKFSPISATNNSPKYITINEDSNDCNHSLILQGKSSTETRFNKSIKLASVDKIDCENKVCNENDADTVTTEKAESNDANAISSIEISSLQTTESEPFLGFSHKAIDEVIAQNENKYARNLLSDYVILKKCITENEATEHHTSLKDNQINTDTENDITELEQVRNSQCLEDNKSLVFCAYNANDNQNKSVNTSAVEDHNNSNLTAENVENDVNNPSDVIDASEENITHNDNHSKEENDVENPSDVIDASEENIIDNDNYSNITEANEGRDNEENTFDNTSDVSVDASEENIIDNDNYSNITEANEGRDNEKNEVDNPSDVSVDATEDRGNDNRCNVTAASEENITDKVNHSNITGASEENMADNDNCSNVTEESEENITNNDSKVSSDINEENGDDHSSECSSADDTNSFYDTCTSEQSSIQDIEDKEPVVLLQKMNDLSFFRYYDKLSCKEDKNNISKSTDTEKGSINSEFASIRDNDSQQSSGNVSEIESEPENGSDNDDGKCEEIECNNDEQNSSSEEKCVSFVTTRRRNEVTNDSMISMFNDSYCSTSTDCDKTVLSNNTQKTEAIDNTLMNLETEIENNEMTDSDNAPDLNQDTERTDDDDLDKNPECLDDTFIGNETRISFVTDRKSSIRSRNSSIKPKNSLIPSNLSRESFRQNLENSRMSCSETKPCIVLRPGKKWERSLSIYRRMTMMNDHFDRSMLDETDTATKGRKYRQSIISTMEMQDFNSSLHNESINSRRSTFVSKPSRSTIVIVKDASKSRFSCNTTVFDDLSGFLNEECDDTIIELSKLSIADQTHEVTVLDNFHDPPIRIATARDYVLRRCNQADAILFDECYPDTVLKNCHKIGEGVYGEVFLWRDRDGRARVLKIVPVAGTLKVNGESQKDFHEIISEIVIAMELSALRAPIADIERHFDEGKDVEALDLHAIENASDIFNEVLAVKCVYGSYPSRLLDLWDLYDECKGSENDNPAILPVDQQFIVLELANAGQDLESYQFNNAEQAHALFLQVAYGLAVAEEAFQFEHRDLHWGNVLIAPTEKKYATFVIRGRLYRVARCGVLATVIDYSLSRASVRLAGERAALYNDLAADETLFDAVGDYQFQVYRLMRDKLRNDWKNFEPYTNILWLHYTVDKMITALRYKRTNTKIHKHYIDKLKGIKSRILDYGSAAQFVLTDNEI